MGTEHELGPQGALVLRAERPGEEGDVRAVVEAAFATEPVVGELVDALRRSPDWLPGLSFVAELDGGVVGHVLFTRSLLDAPRRLVDVLVLSPVSVAPAHQRRGIGTALIRHGMDEVRRLSTSHSCFWRAHRGSTGGSGSSPPGPWDSAARRCASPNRRSRSCGWRRGNRG